jgi:hypothetical protein
VPGMDLVFDVGVQERHRVHFSFDKVWGNMSITVDGMKLTSELNLLSVSLVKKYEFVVGIHERHNVRIEKHRKVFFAGFREQPVYAFVDDQLVAQGVA